jgi:hypothetical protein
LYIFDIVSTPDFGQQRGIIFDTRDELITAISTLGYMQSEGENRVESLIERMLSDIDTGMTRSGLLNALMRGASEPAGPVVGPVTVAKDGWVIGGRFAEHNTYGLPQGPPFRGLSLRINHETNDGGTSRYRLSVTDQVNSTPLDPTRVGLYHTESLLAAQLGRPRLLTRIRVNVFYEQDGPEVDFGFVPIIDSLASIEGLAPIKRSPEDVARGHFEQMRDENFLDWKFQLRATHANGCSLRLNGLSGIQERGDTIGRRLLLHREGDRLMGPFDNVYWPIKPFMTFGVCPPQFEDPSALSLDEVLAANQLTTNLSDALITALWSNNIG